MQVTKKETEPRTYLLDIEVEADAVRKAFGQAYRDFGQYTRVPGFRPGHAPRRILERYVNQDKLRQHVMEILVADAYEAALKQEALEPYDEPEFVPGDLVDGEPWRFQVTVADQPLVELGDYSNIAVERPIVTVTDDDVERAVEGVRNDHASLQAVHDRPVQPDDVIIVDMSITPEGQEPGETGRSLVRLNQSIPGFAEAVTGQAIDETREFTLTFPHDYADPERAGVTARFVVTVASISERALPEVTDEWVRTLGPFETVQEWKDSLRESLQARMESVANDVALSRIIGQLVQRSRIEFPPAMLRDEVENDLRGLSEELVRNNTTYEQYLSMTNLTREEHEARVEAEAAATIRNRLVLRAFARQEGITIDSDEFEERYAEAVNRADAIGVRLAGSEREQRRRLANRLIMDKLRDRLLALATITDVPVSPQTDEG
ncbi:MAG: trigger factor [Chthonomonadales bacterium]|nr:trigger factor [Chthonomonadales bacterium]